MLFPDIKDIATTDLVKIHIDKTIGDAIQLMMQTNHRNIIIEDAHFYHILLAQDILTLNQGALNLEDSIRSTEIKRLPSIHQDKNLLEAIPFLQESIEYIATTNDEGKLVGLLTHSDIVNSTDPEILMENYTIGDVLKHRNKTISVEPSDSTESVLTQLKSADTDCAVIIKDKTPIGIFTIKDVLALYQNRQATLQPICHYMSHPVECVTEKTSIKEALLFIKARKFKRLIVVDSKGYLVGMIMQKDLISMAYNNWAILMKRYQKELHELNELLENKAQRYKQLAAIDPLTNLYNRYRFIELFTSELIAMQQDHHSSTLVMLDIDYFKQINDQFGHNAGDKVLVKTADIIQHTLRNEDILCRWGGEEFVILLPNTNPTLAITIAEKVRYAISEMKCLDNTPITASLGITEVLQDDALDDVILRADKALYTAKKQGRNQTVSTSDQSLI